MKPRYTFSTKGTDGNLYYPKKPGDQTTGWVADWTTDISKAMTWENPEDFDCVMAEYEDTQVVTVFEGCKMTEDKTEPKTLDVKMVIKGKLTPWNEWDYITTVAEAKDYVEAIYEEWFSESDSANDCIVEILESYFEFMEIFERTIKAQKITPHIKVMALELVKKRRAQWEPVLQKAKEMQNKKPQKSGKNTA